MSSLADVKRRAMGLLARREHARLELARKLQAKDFPNELIQQALDQLATAGLQSDHRFTEAYIRMRATNGFGPLRIRQELQQRGVSEVLINQMIDAEIDWDQCLNAAWQKKFNVLPEDFPAQAKQAKFLVYRGFAANNVRRFMQLANLL